MNKISFPYGQEHLTYDFAEGELKAVLTSSIEQYVPEHTGAELVRLALENPVDSPRLSKLAKAKALVGKDNPEITAIPDGVSVVVV